MSLGASISTKFRGWNFEEEIVKISEGEGVGFGRVFDDAPKMEQLLILPLQIRQFSLSFSIFALVSDGS